MIKRKLGLRLTKQRVKCKNVSSSLIAYHDSPEKKCSSQNILTLQMIFGFHLTHSYKLMQSCSSSCEKSFVALSLKTVWTLVQTHFSGSHPPEHLRDTGNILLQLLNFWLWGEIQSWLIGLLRNHFRDLYVIMRNRGAVPIHSAFSPLGVTCNYSCGASGRLTD